MVAVIAKVRKPSPSIIERTMEATIEINSHADVICKVPGKLYFVKSDTLTNRYYPVMWSESDHSWTCSCGGRAHLHSHTIKAQQACARERMEQKDREYAQYRAYELSLGIYN